MIIYEDEIYDKLVRWWVCPFCDRRIIAVYPDHVGLYVQGHLSSCHGDVSVRKVNKAIGDLRKWFMPGVVDSKILAEAVLDKL